MYGRTPSKLLLRQIDDISALSAKITYIVPIITRNDRGKRPYERNPMVEMAGK